MFLNSIKTKRLNLIPLTGEQLKCYLDQEDPFPEKDEQLSRAILTPILQKAILMKLDKLEGASEKDTPWITYWLIKVPPDGFGAGLIGFKGLPDENGEVEIGYGIDPGFRNQGYITEAVRALIQWAFTDPRCKRILAPNTMRSNPASNRVLKKAGMRIYGETPDSISWCIDNEGNFQKS